MTPVLLPCSRSAHDQNVLARRPQRDQHGCHSKREKQASSEGRGRSRQTVLLARRTRTISPCSFDRAVKDMATPYKERYVENRRPSHGLMARLGVPVGGRVRKSAQWETRWPALKGESHARNGGRPGHPMKRGTS